MQEAHSFLGSLALVLCLAAATTVVFQRLRQPVVFGYLLAGMILGPYVPVPLAADPTTVRTFSELGVIMLMFTLGLEFSLRRVIQIAATSGLTALAETSMMLGFGYTLGQLMGWSARESIFLGAIVAISSTTIIAKAFAEQDIRGRVRDVVFGILIVEDLIAIFLVAILSTLATGAGPSAGDVAATGLRLAMFLAGLIGVGLLIIPRLVRRIIDLDRPETTVVACIGICFAAALLALAFGYSVALGAFIAGSLVAESGQTSLIERLIEPVRDMFVAIFFVSVGMLIDPRVVLDHWGAVAGIAVLVIVGKMLAVSVGAFLTGNRLRTALQAGMSLAQIGEFSFIIAAIGVATGSIREFIYPVTVAVSALTTLTTPWLIRASEPVALELDRKLPKPVQTFVALYGSWMEQLGSARATGRSRVNSLTRMLFIDTVLLALLIIGTSLEMQRLIRLFGRWASVPRQTAIILVVVAALVVAIPLVLGVVRSARRLAFILAVRAVPRPEGARVDFAAAPRGTLVTTLQIGIVLVIGAPLLAITQPFLRGFSGLAALAVVVLVLGVAFWRSARNLQGHARAGAEAIVAALSKQMAESEDPEDLTRTMEHMAVVLPGLGEPVPVRIPPGSPAVDKRLADLNVRGMTGATVLAITRPGAAGDRIYIPTGRERLRVNDVLAVAGSHEAVAAAKMLLAPRGAVTAERRAPMVTIEPDELGP
ncbi:MAG TPA: cation:proton antiporter [Gemmatimonadaceae bacterium]